MKSALFSCSIPTASILLAVAIGCGGAAREPEAPSGDSHSIDEARSATPPAEAEHQPPAYIPDDGRGGRVFDRFFDAATFTPDDKKTPGVLDGKGGPFDNGTLADSTGAPLSNDAGHDYRLKNFFGWDLRGAAGIYGPRYMNKKYAVELNLLDPSKPMDEIAQALEKGTEGLPAYGAVLAKEEFEALVHFVRGVREGHLPGPDRIWTLSEGSPGNYRLNPGADPSRGKALYAERCVTCHGSDGTKLLFDDGEYSLGSHARQKAYEDWFKILAGQPGTSMKRMVDGSADEMGQQILDILAALCDRTTFPQGDASGTDAPSGDPRCGAYLK